MSKYTKITSKVNKLADNDVLEQIGNVALLDPSGYIKNDTVNHEDLFTYVNLVAKVKPKSLITKKDDIITLQTGFIKESHAQRPLSIVEPLGKSFLSTNWTNTSSIDSMNGEDLETFGITNIEIGLNAGFIPKVVIDFVDIRGATLFEQGSCSPYAAFFHQPYPEFSLTIKGYYGRPIKYTLAVQSFNTKFNTQTGNYESRGEFIGYTYAFLSDIAIGYVFAAGKMEGSSQILSGIYDDYLKNLYSEISDTSEAVERLQFDPRVGGADDGPITLKEYIRKIESLYKTDSKTSRALIETIKGSDELIQLTDTGNLDDSISSITAKITTFISSWKDIGGKHSDKILTWVNTSSSASDDKLKYSSNSAINEQLIDRDVKAYNETIMDNFPNEPNLLLKIDSIVSVSDDNGISIDLNPIVTDLGVVSKYLSKKLKDVKADFTKKVNSRIKSEIGFIPTVRSFFVVLLANTDLFLELMLNTSADAEEYHAEGGAGSADEILQNNSLHKVSEIVYAWPTYMISDEDFSGDAQTPTAAMVEEYPGNEAKFSDWPEVIFTEKFLKALIEVQKEADGDTVDNQEYEGRVGYDNYIPINAMETPAASPESRISYYGLTSTDDVLKNIGERFITLTNMTSLNSNYLNSSLLLRTRNDYFEKINKGFYKSLVDNGGDADISPVFYHIDTMIKGDKDTGSKYISSGIPYNPIKFGGKDLEVSGSWTYSSYVFQRHIQGVKGYPTILQSNTDTSIISPPMGIDINGITENTKFPKTDVISEYMNKIWNFGYLEALNFVNSIESNTLLSTLTVISQDLPSFKKKIIETLGIGSDDTFVDSDSSWLYKKDITLSGGDFTLKPNIHDMEADSLLRLKKCDNCVSSRKGNRKSFNETLELLQHDGGMGNGRELKLKSDSLIVKKGSLGKLVAGHNIDEATAQRTDTSRRDIKIFTDKNPILTPVVGGWWPYNNIKLSNYAPWVHLHAGMGSTNGNEYPSDGSVTRVGSPAKWSPFSQQADAVILSLCNTDLYPDYGFDYSLDTYRKFLGGGKSTNKGDLNYRYINSFNEFLNLRTVKSTNFGDFYPSWYHMVPSYKHVKPSGVGANSFERFYDYNRLNGTIRTNSSGKHPSQYDFKVIQYAPLTSDALPEREAINKSYETLAPTSLNISEKDKTQKIVDIGPRNKYLTSGDLGMNFVNQGNLLIDTPFWRHNFPSLEVESQSTNSFSYTMFGSPLLTVLDSELPDSDSDDYIANPTSGASYKRLDSHFYMGVKVDPDTFGNGRFLESNEVDRGNNYKDGEKINLLTTHNDSDMNIVASSNNGKILDDESRYMTNLNRTKLWKGSLAYLFLANQLHRPWTGMYTNNNTYYGPQSLLGTSAISAAIPKHSVLLLGAVLWRMKEAGLLESWGTEQENREPTKWNISPTPDTHTDIMEYLDLDPINVPLLPEELIWEKPNGDEVIRLNTKHFGVTDKNGNYNEIVQADIDSCISNAPETPGCKYNWNNGLRPPMASMISNINPRDGQANKVTTITCFPRADEWPALALGMVYAHDLDNIDGFKNPFNRQYKIFTPIMGVGGSLTLRFQNQTPRWLPNDDAYVELNKEIENLAKGVGDDLYWYGSTYKEKKKKEVADATNKHLAENLGRQQKALTGNAEYVFKKHPKIAGTEESYTKLTYVTHSLEELIGDVVVSDSTTSNIPGFQKPPDLTMNENGSIDKDNGRSVRGSSDLSKKDRRGYFRGYIPIGPELWFLPTSVKETFIKEFEDFVGNFNEFEDSSVFDGMLKTIDPLNFPKQIPNRHPKIIVASSADISNDLMLENLTYTTFLTDGTTSGPLRTKNGVPVVVNPQKLGCFEPEYPNCYESSTKRTTPKAHPALTRWINTYNIGYNTKARSRSPRHSDNSNVDVWLTNKVNGQNTDVLTNVFTPLFEDGYVLTQSTPRIWWAELPIDKIQKNEFLTEKDKIASHIGEATETTFDSFYFSEQEFGQFLNGFQDAISSKAVEDEVIEKLKDGIENGRYDGTDDNDLRLTTYRSLKNIYDKWVSASKYSSGERRLFYNTKDTGGRLIDSFTFVDRVNSDIGDKALINIEVLSTLLHNPTNSLFGVISDVLDKSNFNFHPLPGYVDLSSGLTKDGSKPSDDNVKAQALADMFSPLTSSEALTSLGSPHFLCMYVGGNSKTLALTQKKEQVGCLSELSEKIENTGDGIMFSQSGDNPRGGNPPTKDFTDEDNDSAGVVAFKVAFGSGNQSHFLSVDLDQSQHKDTFESLQAIETISQMGANGGANGLTAKGQSLYEVFLGRSYSCSVEAMGNMMIQPMQYFELQNVPMFYGSYLIRDVKHTVKPHDVKTTFVGDRIPQAVVPIIEDVVTAFNLTPSGDNTGSLGGGSGGSNYGGKSGTPIDVSKIPASTNTEKIKQNLSAYKLIPHRTKNGKWLNTEYGPSGLAFKVGSNEPVGITLHWSGGWTKDGAFAALRARGDRKTYNLSYHIEVGEDGVPYQFGDLNRSAAHAGCPDSKGPRCKSLNGNWIGSLPTIAVSYVGGAEGDGIIPYVRTWSEWNTENWSKDGKHFFKAKDQWYALVDSILYAKLVWPNIRFITSHHWSDANKSDVGDNFPWDKLVNELKAKGWNESDAGADPYFVSEWVGKDGKIIKNNKLTIGDDYIITNEEWNELTGVFDKPEKGCPKIGSKGFRENAKGYRSTIKGYFDGKHPNKGSRKTQDSFDGFLTVPEFYQNNRLTAKGVMAITQGIIEGMGSSPNRKNPGNIRDGGSSFQRYTTWDEGWKVYQKIYLTNWPNGTVPATASAKYPNCYSEKSNSIFTSLGIKYQKKDDYNYVHGDVPTLRQYANIYSPWGDSNNPTNIISTIALTLSEYGMAGSPFTIDIDAPMDTWIDFTGLY